MDRLTRLAKNRVGTLLRQRWTIDALIGVGAMAAVYRATHRNGNEVAIKVLHADLSHEEGIRKRFQREGYVANRVKHRGAVTVFDDDVTEDGCAFLVMELLQGENVEARRERLGGFVPLPEVLGIADQVLDALVAAHAQGIVHRDVKPENLFLTTDGVVKVLDFGIARLETPEGGTGLTMVGTMLGTPGFLSPEQARGMTLAIDQQTDVWGVGATLFTLLCGQHVLPAKTMEESLALAATKPARSLASVLPDMDLGVVALVDKALAWEKRDRWADAKSMQRELRRVAKRVLDGKATASSPTLDLELSAALSSPIVPSEPEGPTRVMYYADEALAEPARESVRPDAEEPPTRRSFVPSAAPPANGGRVGPLEALRAHLPSPRAIILVGATTLFAALALALTIYVAMLASRRSRPRTPPSKTDPPGLGVPSQRPDGR